MPIVIITGDRYYIRKIFVANVIDREEDLFLESGRQRYFTKNNEMIFDETNKRVFMEVSKGGH